MKFEIHEILRLCTISVLVVLKEILITMYNNSCSYFLTGRGSVLSRINNAFVGHSLKTKIKKNKNFWIKLVMSAMECYLSSSFPAVQIENISKESHAWLLNSYLNSLLSSISAKSVLPMVVIFIHFHINL